MTRLAGFTWLILATLLPIVSIADEPKKPSPTDTTNPKPLFDGKTLDGWKKTDFFKAGNVTVDDGTIVMALGGPMTGITTTRDDLPRVNYELTYEARRDSGRDFFAAATFPVGKSYMTFVNGGWGGSVTGLSSINGSDASENETGTYFKFADKTWYRFKIRVTDRVVRCWVDDKVIVDFDREGREVKTRVESRSSQPLGFSAWNTGGSLRNIGLRSLTADEVAATRPKEQ